MAEGNQDQRILEKELAKLRRQLNRSEENRKILEAYKDKHERHLSQVIQELHEAKVQLQKSKDELEERVHERTADLTKAVDQLRQEVIERQRVESKLQILNRELSIARDQAVKNSLAKSNFLTNMSHELRTPLNAIIGYSELILEELGEIQGEQSTTIKTDLGSIHKAAKHLLDLINGILDLSKIEAGKMQLEIHTFDVGEMLRNVIATVTPVVEQNNNQFCIHYVDNLGCMKSDHTKVRQSLINLLSNAGKFTENGRVELSAERTEINGKAMIRFVVSDTGIGIPDAFHPIIFDAFTQVDGTSQRKYGGAGLGLAITNQFCRMMGGTIKLKSQVGVGTEFQIYLPAQI